MINPHILLRATFIAASITLLANVSSVHSQHITRIAPSNITLHGISIADYNHTMVVGDSAMILINSDFNRDTTINGNSYVNPIQNFILLDVRNVVSKSLTFYGVSYYDSHHAIVVGDAGTILLTSDKGKSWWLQTIGSNTLRAVTHVDSSIFQIVGDGGTILRSVDSGTTWQSINATTKSLYAEAFASPNVGLIAGESGTMLKTTDGGQNWTLQPNASDKNLNFYGVAMLDENTATAVGDSALFRYTTNGTDWKTKRDSNVYAVSIDTSVRNSPIRAVAYTGYPGIGTHYAWNPAAVAVGNADLLYNYITHFYTPFVKQPHNDTTWIPHDSIWQPLTAFRVGDADGAVDGTQSRYNCIAIYHAGNRFLTEWAGQGGALAVCVDSTTHSFGYGLNPAKPSFDNFLFASFDSAGYGYCTETGSIVRKTSDNGYTWKNVLTNRDVSGVYCLDSNRVFVAGWGGQLFRTTNGGVKWDSLPHSTDFSLHGFAFTSPTTGFCVGNGGTVLQTVDGGATWVNTNIYESYYLAVAFFNSDTGVIVGKSDNILNTTDGGITWTANQNVPLDLNANLKYIYAFPDGICYVGADSGVIRSSDYGQNWAVVYNPPDSVGISFYNSKIGIVGLYSTSSKLVPDSMTLVFTRDGLKTTYQFSVPFYNVHRLLAHWLNDCSFLLYGTDGFIMKVDFCGVSAVSEIISPASPPMKVYPNPSSQRNVTVEYQTEKDGEVTIELWDELGKRITSLYSGFELQGMHQRTFSLNADLHGTFFIRKTEENNVQTLRIIKL